MDEPRLTPWLPGTCGEPTPRIDRLLSTPVYPRACGEQSLSRSFAVSMVGSSPCVRGTDVSWGQVAAAARFIPVRAGNRPHKIV